MPAPQAALLKELAKLQFRARMTRLPTQWKPPSSQYPDAFQAGELPSAPGSPMNLFREPDLCAINVKTATKISNKYAKYIDGACDAICFSIDKWMKSSMVVGMIINGPVGMVLPGSVQGIPLGPLILAKGPKSTPMEIAYTTAISQAFDMSWRAWHMGMTGTLMYPSFAVFPGPVAPPMPNIPMPVIALPSAGEGMLAPTTLSTFMLMFLGNPLAPHAKVLFDSIAMAFATVFPIFKATSMVTNVLGMGPIPTFAPPVVPAGPVVMGTSIPKPGSIV